MEKMLSKSSAKSRLYCLGLDNKLNDQLPRDYNKTSVFGTDWIKLTSIYYKCSLTTPRWFCQINDSIVVDDNSWLYNLKE